MKGKPTMKSIRKFFLVLPALLFALIMTAATAPTEAQAAPANSDYYDYGYYSCDGHVHWVAAGESLSKIARKYSVTVYALAEANGLAVDSHIYVYQKLCIPKADGYPNGCAWYHKVRKGDTLAYIAKYYHIDYHSLAAANHISNPDHIYYGQKICIPQIYGKPIKHYGDYGYDKGHHDYGYDKGHGHGHDKGHDKGHHGYYVVQKGDTLAKIARWYGVSVYHLVKINHISDPDHIYYGQKIKIGHGW